jgi:hypothetical protein
VKHVLTLFFWCLAGTMPLVAQDAIRIQPDVLSKGDHMHNAFAHDDGTICGTMLLAGTAEWRESLRAYHEAREAGRLPVLGKRTGSVAVGDTLLFNINEAVSGATPNFQKRPFILRAEAPRTTDKPGFRIWTDIPEADVRPLLDEEIDAFARSLVDETPAGSINSQAGTLANNESVFGEPGDPFGGTPNFDGDGITDFVIYEIPSPPGLTIVGFFSPTDINPAAPDNVSNKADILYLHRNAFDRVGTSNVHSVAAHEYQHLIHARFDDSETPFVNEGQSELAQSLNGYPAEVPFFLFGSNPEYNVSLFQYRRGETEVLNDYARASLWSSYAAEQLGLPTMGMVTRNPKSGYPGYRDVVDDSGSPFSINELIANYHTANYVNDLTLGSPWGYQNAQRKNEVRVRVPASRIFDAARSPEIGKDTVSVEPGGVEYLVWENVGDLTLNIDAAVGDPTLLALRRQQVLLRAILHPAEGARSVFEFQLSDEPVRLDGLYERVVLVIAHVRPEATPVSVEISASWVVDAQRQVFAVQYDDGSALQSCGGGGCAFSFGAGADGGHATRFVVPPGAALNEVAMANYYLSQFSNGGQAQDAPRNFLLTVWAGNGQGFPGEVLFQTEVDDPRPVSSPLLSYDHAEIDLEPFVDELFPLPDTIYVGALETGADQNFMVALPDRYLTENVSFIRGRDQSGREGWTRLWDVTFSGQSDPDARPLNKTVLPTRATFVVDARLVAVEGSDVPEGFVLEQNYPNPFNPSTTIEFTVARADVVRLSVHDVTGRQVAVLVDGPLPSGSYQVAFEAAGHASGVYIYTLETANHRQSRSMLLLK